MKPLLFALLLIFVLDNYAFAQTLNRNLYSGDTIKSDPNERWVTSCVNIYAYTDQTFSKGFFDATKNFKSSDNINLNKIVDSIRLRQEYRLGTATYIEYHNRFYLMTARHIVVDTSIKDSVEVYSSLQIIFNAFSDNRSNRLYPNALNIYSIRNSYGLKKPYALTNVDKDLALLYLDTNYYVMRFFKNMLDSLGYKPIKFSDVGKAKHITKGEAIQVFGFPSHHANIIPAINRDNGNDYPYYSYPVITYGFVAYANKKDDYFIAKTRVAPGNSGGPCIINDKLEGIISRTYPLWPINFRTSSKIHQYMSDCAIISKASSFFPLFKQLEDRFPFVTSK